MPESPSHPVHALRLEPLSGPDIEPITLEGRHSLTLGRSTRAGVVLDDPGVSRMHARFSRIAGAWVLADLTSKHGTFINAAALTPGEPTPVAVGDLIRIGPWTFRVRADDADSSSVLTSDDRAQTATRIRSVSDDELGGIAQHRLNLLIDCAASISAASSIEALAEVVLDACLAGAGYARAAMVRPLSAGGDVQVLASRAVVKARRAPAPQPLAHRGRQPGPGRPPRGRHRRPQRLTQHPHPRHPLGDLRPDHARRLGRGLPLPRRP